MLINSLGLPSRVADASPSSPRHLQFISYSSEAGLGTKLFR